MKTITERAQHELRYLLSDIVVSQLAAQVKAWKSSPHFDFVEKVYLFQKTNSPTGVFMWDNIPLTLDILNRRTFSFNAAFLKSTLEYIENIDDRKYALQHYQTGLSKTTTIKIDKFVRRCCKPGTPDHIVRDLAQHLSGVLSSIDVEETQEPIDFTRNHEVKSGSCMAVGDSVYRVKIRKFLYTRYGWWNSMMYGYIPNVKGLLFINNGTLIGRVLVRTDTKNYGFIRTVGSGYLPLIKEELNSRGYTDNGGSLAFGKRYYPHFVIPSLMHEGIPLCPVAFSDEFTKTIPLIAYFPDENSWHINPEIVPDNAITKRSLYTYDYGGWITINNNEICPASDIIVG